MSFPTAWSQLLKKETVERAKELENRTLSLRESGTIIFPPQDQLYKAFELTEPYNCKVVIIGQDPYFNPGQANGLAFSVQIGTTPPPSLKNIYKELNSDINCGIPQYGDLSAWAEQGVLLVNTALTVKSGLPGSHAGWGWQTVVVDALQALSNIGNPLFIMAWGRHAQSVAASINWKDNQYVFATSHPSPLGATKQCGQYPSFIGSKPFSKANEFLTMYGITPIDWGVINNVHT